MSNPLLAAITEYKATLWAAAPSVDGSNLVSLPYFNREPLPCNIKVAALTIPAIPADTRQVVTLILGQLRNPKQACIGFFKATASDTNIQRLAVGTTGLLDNQKLNPGSTPSVTKFGVPGLTDTYAGANILFVTEDYQQAARGSIVHTNHERHGAAGSSFSLVATGMYSFTYQSIGVGVLIGHYGSFGNGGAFDLNKNVELESAWLTQSGSDTVLNMAFYNRDVTPNTAKSLKVAVYE